MMNPTGKLHCRFCKSPLDRTFVDLGLSPIANDYVPFSQRESMEPFYPLHVYVCTNCWLVQLPEHRREDEIFTDKYAYFSSYSSTWLVHAQAYVAMMCARFGFGKTHLVVELASNDGYLLQYFKEKGIPVLGIEPTKNTAAVAKSKGIPTLTEFFGLDVARDLVRKGKQADLLIGNNVLAHVPDLNDFVAGMRHLLKPDGIITMEFPHLLKLMQFNQFDTIYHEHYSYFFFIAVESVFVKHGLTIFDVEEIPTHGGSLRIYGKHTKNAHIPISKTPALLKEKELRARLTKIDTYTAFAEKVKRTKREFLELLITAKKEGRSIVGYGAPAKGNTFLNYCGVRTDFIDYTVDASPHKQNHFLPGVRIPIYAPEKMAQTKPEYVFILPWNLKEEIMTERSYIRQWGGKFVVAIPKLEVFS